MPKVPGVNHLDAIGVFGKAGFLITRHNPVNAYTMADIVRDAGLKLEQSRRLL